MRYFVIGDIHGCFDEFLELLDKAALTADDHIVSIGDIVNRGPDSQRALEFFRQGVPNIYAIMGNHEHKHLRAYRGEIEPTLSILMTRWQLNGDYEAAIHYMASLPIYIELPDAVLVHGYYEPGVSLHEQQERVLVGTMGAAGYLEERYQRPWYEHYDGEKPLIVGHKDWSLAQQPFNYRDRVYGLDTGCVYGGRLTGILLPDFEFITVTSRRAYWQQTLADFQELS